MPGFGGIAVRSAATGAVLPLLRVAARAGEGAAGARGVLVPVSAPAVRVAAPRSLLLRLGISRPQIFFGGSAPPPR